LQSLHGEVEARGTVLKAVQILEELATAQPKSRPVHGLLSQSLLLLGSLETGSDAAVAAFERAEAIIAPFARGSREGSILATWTAALVCLGRFEEAGQGIEILDAQGYAEPGLLDLCSLQQQ
jgi:hypothetical protein